LDATPVRLDPAATLRGSDGAAGGAGWHGLSPGEPCAIVMNRHAKTSNAMHHEDVGGLVDLIGLVREIGATPVVVRFDRILEPAGEITELCIGGPGSNERARVHLKTYLPGVEFRPFAPRADDHLAITVGGDVHPYQESELEHAVLVRFFPEASSHPVILVCGQSARSNHAAISYLTKHYERSVRLTYRDDEPYCFVLALRSPLVYGVKSVHLANDVTTAAFAPASRPDAGDEPSSAKPVADGEKVDAG
jgi:hypothetical protein